MHPPEAVPPVATPTFQASVAASAPPDPLAALPKLDGVELAEPVIPPELHDEIEFAFERAGVLASHNRQLHFSRDQDTGRIVVQIRDLDGGVIRVVPSADALAIMAGRELD